MNYAGIREMDISNGEGVGVALFVQGCHFHCYNCFNSETWDFNGGKEWNEDIKGKFLKLIDKPYIKRVTILGGEPLANENLEAVLSLTKEIRILYPDKTIWIYSGYTWNQIMHPVITDDFNPARDKLIKMRKEIVANCDVLIDGRYVDELRDITLHWRGSSNQRVIDIQKTLKSNSIILYEE